MPVIPSPYASYQHFTSGGNIVRRALRLLGVIDPDTNLSDRELANGIEALNQMVDNWNTQVGTVPALFRFPYDISAGESFYTIGPGANIDVQTPTRLDEGTVYLQQTDGSEFLMKEMSQRDYANLVIKSLTGRPEAYYFEKGSPFAKLYIYPINIDAYSIVIYIEQKLAQITNPQSQFALEEGYAKALTYNLAVELSPEYPAAELSPLVVEIAGDSLADIKRVNIDVPMMRCESGMNDSNEDFRREEFGIP